MALYTQAQIDRVVKTALAVTKAAIDGEKIIHLRIGTVKHGFNLVLGGRCQEFVRECFEAANGWRAKSWRYAKPNARQALAAMAADGHRLPNDALLHPGDVLGHTDLPHGHIGIYVGSINGVEAVCENTISGKRGEPRRPGTKRTPLRVFRYTHAMRLGPTRKTGVFVNGKQIAPAIVLLEGRCYVPRRVTAQALGAVIERPQDPGAWVNGERVEQRIRDGIGWVWARDLARLTGASVQYQAGRLDFTTAGGGSK
jgi:hypothetical protein